MKTATATSRITAQGQTSVPAEIRRRLGVGPGSVLKWDVEGDHVAIRRAGGLSFEDIHRALFSNRSPRARTVDEMDDGIRRAVKKRWLRARR